jgi:hypothetical protein
MLNLVTLRLSNMSIKVANKKNLEAKTIKNNNFIQIFATNVLRTQQ